MSEAVGGPRRRKGFSLIESVTAIAILALISSSVLVVIDRCISAASDLSLRMNAFELARENMERLLGSTTVKEMSEYGESDRHPGIMWSTVVETFYEPVTSEMWVRGVCSATYSDGDGEEQTVELTHWLTNLSKEQMAAIDRQQEQELADLGEDMVETVEEAAEYAGVDKDVIEQWVDDGMPIEPEGWLWKDWLDLYAKTDGRPSEKQKEKVREKLAALPFTKPPVARDKPVVQPDPSQEINPLTGLTTEQEAKLSFEEMLTLMLERSGRDKL